MATWSFLTNHARALLILAEVPDTRLRDLADALDVTERTAYGIVTDLAEADYIHKERDGRRNRYEVRRHLPVPDQMIRDRTVGDLLAVLAGPGVMS